MSFHKQDEGKALTFLFKFFHCFWVQLETQKDLKNFSEETGNHVKLMPSEREVFLCCMNLPRHIRVKEQWQEREEGSKETACQQLVLLSSL